MKTNINLRIALIALFLTVSTLSFGQFVVVNDADSGPGSLRQAVLDADLMAGPNTITFNDDYTINLTSGKIVIHDDLVITGTGIGNTIIDGSGNNNLRPLGAIGFSNLEISGITFRNSSSATDAGALGIAHVSNATITNCEFIDNLTTGLRGAGALGVTVTNLTIDNCIFKNNSSLNPDTSSGGGVGHDSQGTLTILNSTFEGNISHFGGGAVAVNSPDAVTIDNSSFIGNIARGSLGYGGAIHILGLANTSISNSRIMYNKAFRQGGAIWNNTGEMTIHKTQIDYNEAEGDFSSDGGGAIFNNGGIINTDLTTTIAHNFATGTSSRGGGILSTSGSVNILNSTLNNNGANQSGGAIEIVDGNLTILNTDVVNNHANGTAGAPNPGIGGGLSISGNNSVVTIENSIISRNSATKAGGAISLSTGSEMVINHTNINGNKTYGNHPNDGGAGIFNNGNLEINTSTISNNRDLGTNGSGGGIYNSVNGDVNVTVSTISSNSVNGSGGGIYNKGINFFINASTIANNTAVVDGGGIESTTITSLKNSIVSNNNAHSGFDVSGNLVSNDYNLIGTDDTSAFPEKSNDIEEANAALGPLRNNGSGMLIHELTYGSAALNSGDPGTMFTDQIGQPVFGSVRDIGAFEVQEILLSIDDFGSSISDIALYPNPSKGIAMVKIPASFGSDIQISLIELGSGKVVQNIATTSGTSELNLDRFSDGVYVLKIISETTSTTQRLILSK